ncbi:MAG: NAD(P)H-dependent oxidoreductase [Bryobacterales bacterium]|nr:NAD(P)H-dependent oxidoreductase [Bryobacterales bacterium]
MENSPSGPRVVIINGSARPGNYTAMASALVADEFRKIGLAVDVVNPGELELPLPGTAANHPGAARLQSLVAGASALVLATPEYHGSFSSVIKLAIENMGFPSAMAGKPVALLGVAAGAIGAIKSLEALRGIVSHVGGLALPMPVSVANVQRVFDAQGVCLDPVMEKYIRRVATNVRDYLTDHVCPKYTLERILREGMPVG